MLLLLFVVVVVVLAVVLAVVAVDDCAAVGWMVNHVNELSGCGRTCARSSDSFRPL